MAHGVWTDLKYGVRLLLRHPGFTLVAVSSLALGIGANTALFSVTDALMFRMLPVKRAGDIVRLKTPLSYPAYRTIRDRTQTLSGMFPVTLFPATVRIGEDAEQAVGQMVSGNFYSVLGVNAALGRLLSPDDDRIPGAGGADGPVAVLSYEYWLRRFALDPAVVGRTITFNGAPVAIVGVAPAHFFGVFQTLNPDVTVPIALQPRVLPSASTELWAHGDEGSFLSYDITDSYGPPVMGLLKPGVSLTQAQAELTLLYRQIVASRKGVGAADRRQETVEQKVELAPAGNGSGNFDPQARALLLVVMSAVPAVVLLIACANVATLLLARGAARQREVAVRLATGAGRVRLIRQFLTESLVLAIVGGAAGLVVASWSRRLLLAWIASRLDFPFVLQAETDSRTLAFTLAVSVAAALVFGLVPAIRGTKTDLSSMLKAGGRTLAGASGWSTGKVLVAAQVALSLLLLVCAGLLVRTVRNLQLFDPGFDRDHLYLVTTNFLGYKGPQTGALLKAIQDGTASLPGARAVGIAQDVPPASDRRLNVTVADRVQLPSEKMYVDRLLVGPGFFDAMGIPLLAGRGLTPRDDEHAPNVCVVSAAMARAFFPDRSPLGHHFTFKRTGAEYEVEIVGVARDLKKAEPNGEWRPVYCPMLQDLPSGGATVLIRTGADAASVLNEARRRFRAIDRNLFLDVKTMDRRTEDTVFLQRLLATLSGVFSLLALLLASVGLYGVMAYSVARRTNEVGIRMALGADRRRVVAIMVRETMTLVGGGVLVGMAASWAATRLIASTLFGLSAMDPLTLTLAIGVMAAVALMAGYIPARRAARVDPVIALRQE